MHAKVGDRVRIKARAVGMPDQTGEIVEVRGSEGAPPYLVRFANGHESLVYPGPDSVIEPRSAEE
ncbi:DUF1918 domain-containing protein [Streptomyces sp. KLMMK]|uniref:DUF1918 domain-containing protein n=1 Tax=Streptomyces sp. KLMMK TaxID=3109353 RepID=UPI0030002A3A